MDFILGRRPRDPQARKEAPENAASLAPTSGSLELKVKTLSQGEVFLFHVQKVTFLEFDRWKFMDIPWFLPIVLRASVEAACGREWSK